MNIQVIKSGLQTMLQGAPYQGHRHIGLPAAGAADSLSLALANRLVGNKAGDLAVEIALSGASFTCKSRAVVAVTGAACDLRINGKQNSSHKAIVIEQDDVIRIGPAQKGCHSYLAIGGSFKVDANLGSKSTYLPAGLGGFHGRALKDDDDLPLGMSNDGLTTEHKTPDQFVPVMGDSTILRVIAGPEFDHLSGRSQVDLFAVNWTVDQRMSRMGLMLTDQSLRIEENGEMPSGAVFSGTIQCPPDGSAFLLGPDAQTTGGYPRIAQVIRADRHLIGQLRPGSKVQLVRTTPEQATKIYREKLLLLKPWLGDIQLW